MLERSAFALSICAVTVVAATPAMAARPHVNRPMSVEEKAALSIVNRRIAAYNAHDLEAFVGTYEENFPIYTYPDKLMGSGRQRMRAIFGPQFARRQGKIAVLGQHVLEGRVVSDEVNRIGTEEHHAIAIYTVRNGLIAEVRLIEKGR